MLFHGDNELVVEPVLLIDKIHMQIAIVLVCWHLSPAPSNLYLAMTIAHALPPSPSHCRLGAPEVSYRSHIILQHKAVYRSGWDSLPAHHGTNGANILLWFIRTNLFIQTRKVTERSTLKWMQITTQPINQSMFHGSHPIWWCLPSSGGQCHLAEPTEGISASCCKSYILNQGSLETLWFWGYYGFLELVLVDLPLDRACPVPEPMALGKKACHYCLPE